MYTPVASQCRGRRGWHSDETDQTENTAGKSVGYTLLSCAERKNTHTNYSNRKEIDMDTIQYTGETCNVVRGTHGKPNFNMPVLVVLSQSMQNKMFQATWWLPAKQSCMRKERLKYHRGGGESSSVAAAAHCMPLVHAYTCVV